jgi:hypothetical protein
MSTTLRRYELLLPLRFNDGQPVPDSLIADSLVELEQRFGAVSSETQVIFSARSAIASLSRLSCPQAARRADRSTLANIFSPSVFSSTFT